ncbi:MAG: ABC transporter permease [Gemmatimonadales bacterium]
MLQELRRTARGLARRPLFAAAAIITTALGIGATVTIYSLVKSVLLTPLPFEQPDRLVTIDVRSSYGNLISLSVPNYRDWRDQSRVFSEFAGAAGWSVTETGHGPATVMRGNLVLGPLFQTLGMASAVGRVFSASETEPGTPPVAVLSYGFWQRRFGGDPGALGRTITLDETPYTVIGVLQPDAGWPSAETDVYLNMGSLPRLPWDTRSSSFGMRAVARLAPGRTPGEAQADLDRVWRSIAATEGDRVAKPEVRTLTDFFVGDVRTELWALLTAVGFLLLIGIVNVANLQLARGEERRRELAIRTALGARRAGLMRLLLMENLLLGLAGGAGGLALALIAVRAVVPALAGSVPQALQDRIGLDGHVVLFALGLSLVAGILFGLVPALRASGVQPSAGLTTASRSTTGAGRLNRSLVAVEVALALVLLIGAGLAVRSLRNLRATDTGFVADGVLTARVDFPSSVYGTAGRWLGFQRDLLERVSRLADVQSAAMSLEVPLGQRSWEMRTLPEGAGLDEDGQHTLFNMVTPDWFRAMGVPILAGRGFTAEDREDAVPIAIIDETMAERLWPGENPLGKRIYMGERPPDWAGGPDSLLYRQVVGITRNVRHYTVAEPSRPQAYIPVDQAYNRWGTSLYVILRAAGDPERLAPDLRREVAALDPDVAVSAVLPERTYVDQNLSSSRIMGALLGGFSTLALVLAAIGIFGVMAYSVSRRTRELGIRLALGGSPARLIGGVIRSGLSACGIGVVAGLAGALYLTRLLAGLLYGVKPVDPLTYGALAAVMLGVAFLASWLPARNIGRIDPVQVLSEE